MTGVGGSVIAPISSPLAQLPPAVSGTHSLGMENFTLASIAASINASCNLPRLEPGANWMITTASWPLSMPTRVECWVKLIEAVGTEGGREGYVESGRRSKTVILNWVIEKVWSSGRPGLPVWWSVILLDWSGVDLTPKSTPHAKKAVELQDSSKIQCKLPY